MAIELAHDQLSFKKSANGVDMRDYLKALCANIDPRRPNLTIDTEFEAVSIPLDRAVTTVSRPCAFAAGVSRFPRAPPRKQS
jgi:two-component sensor histidine kinase